jgi:pyruvate formate lyase activating enzyme
LEECLFYDVDADRLRCRLCPFACAIAEDATGRCGARQNVGGKLVSLNFAQVTSAALDPIEKKPLYHFHPGSAILSLGTFGCNLKCEFCQNWSISQQRPPTQTLPPAEAVRLALDSRARGNIGIAFTYNEPFIWFEYVLQTARLAREAGLLNVLVTNGIVEEQPLRELLPFIDAMNVDIKSIRPEFYRKLCGGDGRAAQRTVELAWGHCTVEITNLVIPGENDSPEDLTALFDWAASVSPKLPVHLSRYHPDFQMNAPATPAQTLRRAYDLARERLDFVYVGNLDLAGTTDTICPACGAVAVERSGFTARARTSDGRCPQCHRELGIAV